MNLTLRLRSRVELFKGSDQWHEVTIAKEFPAGETALLLCDVWDTHTCKTAARRCGVLAEQIARVVESARAKGVTIIHAPSDCMDFYKDAPQRKRMKELSVVEPPAPRELPDPPLPIDDSDWCEDDPPCNNKPAKWPWTRESAAIRVADEDFISQDGREVYNLFRQRGINTLLICGVHTNMCVMKRSFAIKQMTRWGVPCILLRDLTDALYNPRQRPHVTHDEGTELVVQHIEKNWCPTTLSGDLVKS